jgi:hypothetical protein
MTEQKCSTCHEKGMNHTLAMSHAQQFSKSPWFSVAYCQACGHVDGIFATDVFTITPRVPCSILPSLRT